MITEFFFNRLEVDSGRARDLVSAVFERLAANPGEIDIETLKRDWYCRLKVSDQLAPRLTEAIFAVAAANSLPFAEAPGARSMQYTIGTPPPAPAPEPAPEA